MPNLLGSFNDKPDHYNGVRLAKMLSVLFVIFLILGLSIGFIVSRFSSGPVNSNEASIKITETSKVSYEGIVTFVEPLLYPGENISFALTSVKGKEIILLRAKDKKLEVSEGHYVTVHGEKYKTKDGKSDYLMVDTIVIKNGTN